MSDLGRYEVGEGGGMGGVSCLIDGTDCGVVVVGCSTASSGLSGGWEANASDGSEGISGIAGIRAGIGVGWTD